MWPYSIYGCTIYVWLALVVSIKRYTMSSQAICPIFPPPSSHSPLFRPFSTQFFCAARACVYFLHIIIFYASWLLDTGASCVFFTICSFFRTAPKSCCHVQINKRVTDKKVIYYFIHIWQINLMTLRRLTLAH